MPFQFQPTLENEFVKIQPLKASDFDLLFSIASDPLLWEQHPSRTRYQRDVFEVFFKGAIESKGAFLVLNAKTGEVIGSSRFYDYDEEKKCVAIGYTFVARSHWGKGYNPALKRLMMEHAFQNVDKIIFHIGASNIRSQKAIEKIGAKKIGEAEISYYGERNNLNFIYQIEKRDWKSGNE